VSLASQSTNKRATGKREARGIRGEGAVTPPSDKAGIINSEGGLTVRGTLQKTAEDGSGEGGTSKNINQKTTRIGEQSCRGLKAAAAAVDQTIKKHRPEGVSGAGARRP